MKKILFCVIIIMVIGMCSGCVDIVYKSYTTKSGERVMEWSVTLEDTYTTAKDPLDAVVQFLQQEKENRTSTGRNVELIVEREERRVILRESYSTLNEMYLAYGYTGYEKSEPNASESINLLFSEVYSEAKFVSNKQIGEVYEHFEDVLSIDNPDFEQATLQFEYGTPYKTVYGKNNDSTYTKDNLTFYVWNVDLTNVENADIILVQRIPTIWVWEGIAVASAVVVIGVVIIVSIIKKRRTNVSSKG